MTVLELALSDTLQGILQGTSDDNGVWAYAVYFDTAGTAHWTTLVEQGAIQNGGTTAIDLPQMQGGKIYFLVQSQDESQPYDLTTLITAQSDINWNNAADWSFRYDSFEFTLQNGPDDVGNLTEVEGFGLPMGVSITYQDGATSTLGYKVGGTQIFDDIQQIDSAKTYLYQFSGGPLQTAGVVRAAISPSQAVGLNPTNPAFQPSDWAAYIQSLAQTDPSNPVILSGFLVGTTDANNVYHNGGFYAYTLSWDGTDFWLKPTTDENGKPYGEILGLIKISPDELANSIYETLGTATIYNEDGTPYQILDYDSNTIGVGDNNQWGNVLTQLFSGFSPGFFGSTGQALAEGGAPVNLNNNWNWDPTYAFGSNLTGDAPIYMDPYSEIFFHDSNSYGSNYSDNLMKLFSVGGPQISVYDNTAGSDVATINITLYADGEQPQGYVQPVIYNYLSGGGSGYQVPVYSGDLTTLSLSLANQTMVLDDSVPIRLDIYSGESGGSPVWQSVTLQGTSDVSLWQVWDIGYSNGAYTVAATGETKPPGTVIFNNFPKAEDGVAWYRLTVGTGDTAKTFNLYTTTQDGELLNPSYSGQQAAMAIDGLAQVVPESSQASTIDSFNVNFLYNVNSSLHPSLLVENTDPSFVATLPPPGAPVAGTLDGAVFTALEGQTSQVSNSITTSSSELAFAWTGENSDPNTKSWISGYTNKIDALHAAVVSFSMGGGSVLHPVYGIADIDGQWTTAAATLGNGTYEITMTEYLLTGGKPGVAAGATSSVLTVTVDIDEVALLGADDGLRLAFGDEDVGAGNGNWVRLDVVDSRLAEGTLLVYAVDEQGQLVSRDGQHVGGGVTLAEATLGQLGSVSDDHGDTLFDGSQSVYLRAGLELRFALLTGDGLIEEAPNVQTAALPDGSVRLWVDGFQLSAVTDNTLDSSAQLAQAQRSYDRPWVYLEHGDILDVQVAGSCANTNTLGFVRIDVDPASGDWSVGGVAYGDSAAFHQAVLANLDSGISVQKGGGDFDDTLTWSVAGQTGYYAPVLLTESGDVYVSGTANPGGHEQIRMFGENTFGIEDLAYDQGSDFDYNDMLVKLVHHSDNVA